MKWNLYKVLILTAFIVEVKGKDGQNPPKITSTFNNEYFFPRDVQLSDAIFNCKAQGSNIRYEWKVGVHNLTNDKYVSVNNTLGTLQISWMETDRFGTYQCFANNNFGTSVSKPFSIKESRLSSFPSSDVQEVQCKQYEYCVVKCRDKPTCLPESQCKVEWKIGEGTRTNVDISKRVGVDGNGDLHFLWTNTTDWTGQQYRCGVWHEQMKKFVAGSYTELKIDSTLQPPEKLEPILKLKENGKALLGEKGVLRCMFSGYPTPDVEWTSPTNLTIKNTAGLYEVSDFGRVLTILQAKPEHEGHYFCKGIGETKTQIEKVFFNVTSAPILVGNNQMQDITVPVGKDAMFRCNVSSLSMEFPPSTPKWKKNGVDLDISGGKFIVRENNHVLTVTNVQKVSNTGVYQCMSGNSEGVLLKEAILKVLDPIIIRERPKASYKILPGDVVSLAVVADSDPSLTLQYKWIFTDSLGNEKEVDNSEYWKTSWPNNNLTIDVRQVSDPGVVRSLTGEYSVKIYHNHDQTIINITVTTDIVTTGKRDENMIATTIKTKAEDVTKILETSLEPDSKTTVAQLQERPFVKETGTDLSFLIYIAVIGIILIIVIVVVILKKRQNKPQSTQL